jgi:hypothetical protein
MEGGDHFLDPGPDPGTSRHFLIGGEGMVSTKEIESRYSDAFAELDPGDLQHFKQFVDHVDRFFDLLANPRTDFRIKLANCNKLRMAAFEFCQYYAKWLGNQLMERLKHEIYKLLKHAIDWWGWQETFYVMEG